MNGPGSTPARAFWALHYSLPELFHAVFALKALDAPGSIDQALLPSIERMAIRAYFDMDFRQGGTRFEGVATCTRYEAAAVSGMDLSFHFACFSLIGSINKNNIAWPHAQISTLVRV
jgi:hypothetical protein